MRIILNTSLPFSSAEALSATIKARRISCAEVMTHYLSEIAEKNGKLNAIVNIKPSDELIADAVKADRLLSTGEHLGWMHGFPYALKDLLSVSGLPTTFGFKPFTNNMTHSDGLVSGRIRKSGAIFVGKTNTPEFGFGSHTYNSLFGTTKNAWNQHLTAGGSSGGSAVAVASGMVPVAEGTDLMGSVRNPAAFNNIYGLRPTQGRIPDADAASDVFYQQLRTVGPLAKNMTDLIRFMQVLEGFDPASPLSRMDAIDFGDAAISSPLKDVRIGWMGDVSGYLQIESGILEMCEAALDRLESAGAQVSHCQPDFVWDELWESWTTLRQWSRHGMTYLLDRDDYRTALKPEVIWELDRALVAPAQKVYDAAMVRSSWFRELSRQFSSFDLIALPSAQVFPFDADTKWPDTINGKTMDTYHRWMEVTIYATLAGVPALNVPVGFGSNNRAMGMQILAPYGEDAALMKFGLSSELVMVD